MTQALFDLGEQISAALPKVVQGKEIAYGELMLRVLPVHLVKALTFLRDDQHCQFKVLADLTAVDFPDRDLRFDVVYNLLSLKHNQRIRVKVATGEDAAVPSVSALFSSAIWLEREAWDMYGIYFSNHPDLRRLLTDYGFEGHPLRKDFPLTGYVEVRYDEDQ